MRGSVRSVKETKNEIDIPIKNPVANLKALLLSYEVNNWRKPSVTAGSMKIKNKIMIFFASFILLRKMLMAVAFIVLFLSENMNTKKADESPIRNPVSLEHTGI